ncbi:hypothetical protein [Corynebacterium lowii]|uniref:hypothetical protein n=1 Tax=Corynebacterium lowii TaxID=1544413 RepID=UPI0006DC92BD|nr:hypothetical protein [Corynebacterium lowii]MDP9851914.1 multisubunit Na+/H+ antiporter MnhG subunit [Corynebacterium lowii]
MKSLDSQKLSKELKHDNALKELQVRLEELGDQETSTSIGDYRKQRLQQSYRREIDKTHEMNTSGALGTMGILILIFLVLSILNPLIALGLAFLVVILSATIAYIRQAISLEESKEERREKWLPRDSEKATSDS